MPKEALDKLHARSKEFQKEARKKAASYIMAGFGLVVGLAWNDAIKAMIEFFFPLDQNSLVAKFIYAALLTAVVVLISMYFIRFINPEEEDGKINEKKKK